MMEESLTPIANGHDKDAEEDDEDYEDDIFDIRDLHMSTKPLMSRRQRQPKHASELLRTKTIPRNRCCQNVCMPVFYLVLILVAATGMAMLGLFFFQAFTSKSTYGEKIVGCTQFSVEDVWVQNYPKLLTESAIRLLDINQDGVPDAVIGFATGADGYNIPPIVCDLYFDGKHPCFGGLLALDGRTGTELWRHYSDHEVYALNCNADLDQDGINDCLAAGRAGVFQAVSGRDGHLLWNFGPQEARNDIMNLYTPQVILDLNRDGVPDILAAHGGDPLADPGSEFRLSGRIIFFSGKDGEVLKWTGIPDQRETYYSPQVLTRADGTQGVLFGTGGETHGGALWYISLHDLFNGNIEKALKLTTDAYKGFMTPAVIVDVNDDGVADIVVAAFNSSVQAIDGDTFKILWNFTIPQSESYSTPAVGYFNKDSTPDFMVKYAEGPGFPIYYQSRTTVLDGLTGMPLLSPYITDTVGSQNSPLTISIEGHGNDIFLYWLADCKGYEGKGGEFDFVEGTNVHEQSRSNFCKLRFKTNGFSQMFMINRHSGTPGTKVYDSEERRSTEYKDAVNTTAMAMKWLADHPEHYPEYLRYSKRGKKVQEKANKHINPTPFNTQYQDYDYIDGYQAPAHRQSWGDIGYDSYGSRKHGRQKRHIGAHDEEGIQRLLSTGTLAPPLPGSDMNHSIDVIFAVYWFFPAKTQAILPGDRDCILKRLGGEKERFDPQSTYYGMDHDAYEAAITKECVTVGDDDSGTFESQTEYNPYNVHMGQMTVYRLRLSCRCKPEVDPDKHKHCSKMLPLEKQAWAAYMGTFGTSYYNVLRDQ
ncbi:PREDICTED: uncharacterized protein LOC106810388 isoform X2 [Priapulus caudatus]|uniref:Uncharacterized protein LOC106810388 isoform X2 n=1 Tax=Priapulus caudatus TaxID=37621 RepID=A0ABM1EAJ0_PRICU|nr:PREDICTED: uncharacterized protein LOC106810388 isoform X2 [Priapulus caudatus]